MIKEDAAPPPMTAGVVGGVPGGGPAADGWRNRRDHQFNSGRSAQSRDTHANTRFARRHSGLDDTQSKAELSALGDGKPASKGVCFAGGDQQRRFHQNLQVISGHPMLVPAAIDAVKQWKYKPYILNGEPVEVDTQITVNFTLVASSLAGLAELESSEVI